MLALAFAVGDASASADKTAGVRGASIDIVVRTSKQAAAKLKTTGEAIGVSIAFVGEPKADASRSGAAADGQIVLGSIEKELAKPGRVRVVPPVFDPAQLAQIARAEPRVTINVFSARKTLPDNILDCMFFEDGLGAALRKPILLRCTLIGEVAEKTPPKKPHKKRER